MRKQNYEFNGNDNCGSGILSIFMSSGSVQSLNRVSVNMAYSMPVQHLSTSTTHPYWVRCLAKAKRDPVAQCFSFARILSFSIY